MRVSSEATTSASGSGAPPIATDGIKRPRAGIAGPLLAAASLLAALVAFYLARRCPQGTWVELWSAPPFLLAMCGGAIAILIGARSRRPVTAVVGAIALVIGYNAPPGFDQCGPRPGNEAAAVARLKVVNAAQTTFAAACAEDGYAQSLGDLALPPSGSSEGLIPPDFAELAVQGGYVLTLRAGPGAKTMTPASRTCNGSRADAVSSYFVESHPATVGVTGQRSFASDERGVIYFNTTGAPIAPGMADAERLPE